MTEPDIEAIRQGFTEPTPTVSELMAENMQLQAEIERLRAALQRIVNNGERGGYAYGVAFAALANERVRAYNEGIAAILALKDKP